VVVLVLECITIMVVVVGIIMVDGIIIDDGSRRKHFKET